MGKAIAYILCFTSVFLFFLPQSITTTSSTTMVFKDQIACTMCDTCENPCQPPVPVSPPPPPPEPHCPPPPIPPPAEPECPPPPAPSSSGVYYFSPPPPPPPSGYAPPTFTYLSPPPPIDGGVYPRGGCGGYCIPPPPRSFVPYFPDYRNTRDPLLINYGSSSTTTLKINYIVASLLTLLPLILS